MSEAYTTSERFCADDADVTFASSDKVLFKIHRSNLVTHSEGFSPPEGTSSSSTDEIVHLTEREETLELLFQFMYPQRQPDLESVDTRNFIDLAESAEKYQVFSAMGTCNKQMMMSYPKFPADALLYAVKHDYPEVANAAAKAVVSMSHISVYERLLPEGRAIIAWTKYHSQWADALQVALGYEAYSDTEHSERHARMIDATRRCFATGFESLQDLDRSFKHCQDGGIGTCDECYISDWRTSVQMAVEEILY